GGSASTTPSSKAPAPCCAWAATRSRFPSPPRRYTPHSAPRALRDLGVPPGAARTGTWLQLVRAAPPSVLATALGSTPETAMRHAARVGTDHLSYPALNRPPTTNGH
ncbi:MAG: hypothetical protein LC799_30755, partial [Actinobacteria bacterium]|nr:hypothetical protein [Actinomycetota bacterium]